MALIRAGSAEKEIRCWLFAENVAGVRAFEAAGFHRDEGKPARSFAMPFGNGPATQHCWVYDGAARA